MYPYDAALPNDAVVLRHQIESCRSMLGIGMENKSRAFRRDVTTLHLVLEPSYEMNAISSVLIWGMLPPVVHINASADIATVGIIDACLFAGANCHHSPPRQPDGPVPVLTRRVVLVRALAVTQCGGVICRNSTSAR